MTVETLTVMQDEVTMREMRTDATLGSWVFCLCHGAAKSARFVAKSRVSISDAV